MPNRGRCPELPIGVAPPLERRYTCSLIRTLLPITSMAISSRNQSASPALTKSVRESYIAGLDLAPRDDYPADSLVLSWLGTLNAVKDGRRGIRTRAGFGCLGPAWNQGGNHDMHSPGKPSCTSERPEDLADLYLRCSSGISPLAVVDGPGGHDRRSIRFRVERYPV